MCGEEVGHCSLTRLIMMRGQRHCAGELTLQIFLTFQAQTKVLSLRLHESCGQTLVGDFVQSELQRLKHG